MAKISYLNNNNIKYSQRLPQLKKELLSFRPKSSMLSQKQYQPTPYGIGIMTGFPLFRDDNLAADYESMINKLKGILPNQFFYPLNEIHISLNVTIRADVNGHHYVPGENKLQYYKEYLDIFRKISFKQFSLKIVGAYPNGILLWEPATNKNEIFKIRKQICEGLAEKRKKDPGFYFDNENGIPIIPNIIHATFMRPFNNKELEDKFDAFLKELEIFNKMIQRGELFSNPLWINEICFLEERFNNEVKVATLEDIPKYYQIEILERNKCPS